MRERHRLPGVELVEPSRLRPRLHYELLACAVAGHELIGIDALRLSADDALVAREIDGVRWHRCLRCDSWLPVGAPAEPARDVPPARDDIHLPLRGKPLRDKIVLRAIAVNRLVHFVVLGAIAAIIFVFAAHREALRVRFYQILTDLQLGTGGEKTSSHGILHEIERAFSTGSGTLRLVGLVFVAYLLYAKRLFGIRGGVEAEERERAIDVGWPALERSSPEVVGAPPPAAAAG